MWDISNPNSLLNQYGIHRRVTKSTVGSYWKCVDFYMNLPEIADLQQPGRGSTQWAPKEVLLCLWERLLQRVYQSAYCYKRAHRTVTSKGKGRFCYTEGVLIRSISSPWRAKKSNKMNIIHYQRGKLKTWYQYPFLLPVYIQYYTCKRWQKLKPNKDSYCSNRMLKLLRYVMLHHRVYI